MPDQKHPHDPSKKSLARWNNEGGAPKGGRAKRPRDPNQLAKFVVDVATGARDDAASIAKKQGENPAAALARLGGLKGGRARAAALSTDERKRIAKAAAEARWRKGRK